MTESPHDDAQKLADLRVLLEVSRQLGANREIDPLLDIIQDASLRVFDCERVTIFLYDTVNEELFSRVATGGKEIRFPANRGIAGEALQKQHIINVPDAYADPRFNQEVDKKTGFRTRNILTSPLYGLNNNPVGVLQVLNKRERPFDAWDEELVSTLSAQAGVALQRQILMEEFIEKKRLQKDMELARDIQQQLLPKEQLIIPQYDLAGWNLPADEAGGDSFDYQKLVTGHIAVVIADVAGHGVGPALIASECRALLRASMSLTETLDRVIPLVNDLLSVDMPPDRFVTAMVGVLDPVKHHFQYASAGQGPLLHFVSASDTIKELPTQGPPFGVMPGFPFEGAETVALAPGDMLVFLTDGFIEWADIEGKPFGSERISEVIRDESHSSAPEIIKRLYERVLEFSRGSRQQDDLTAVILKRQKGLPGFVKPK